MARPIVQRRRVRAPASSAWETLIDVERMPEWTPTVSAVEALTPGPLVPGSRYLVKQRRMPKTERVVMHVERGSRFLWTSRVGGVTTHGEHHLSPLDDGQHVEVEQTIARHGLAAGLVALLTGRRTRRRVARELSAFKSACEGAAEGFGG